MTAYTTWLAATVCAVVFVAQIPAWASDVLADVAGKL